ncbi:cytochrome P450 [Mycena galericulata]|nr:cytochrome P450 [Mycena galericulata]
MSSPVLVAAFAGAGTWRLLNRHAVRGDYALALLSGAFLGFYLCLCSAKLTLDLLIVFFTSVISCTVAYRLSPLHPLADYPGPIIWRLSSMVLSAVSFRGHRHLVLNELHKRYGDIVRIGPNVLSVNSSQGSAVIYGPQMLKGHAYMSPGRKSDVSLFFKHHPSVHAKRRILWTNALSGSALREYSAALTKRTEQLVQCVEARLNQDGEVNLGDCINHWAFDIMGDITFGGHSDLELMRDGDPEGLVDMGKRSEAVLDILSHTPWLMEILWHVDALNLRRLLESCGSMMRRRLQHPDTEKRDLTSYLLDPDIRSGDRPTPSDLELEALVAVQGGADNLSSQLIMAVFLLVTHQQVLHTLQAELDAICPDPTEPLDAKALAGVPYLDAVINETFRFSSPWFLPRVVPNGGVTIDNRSIPEGTIVAVAHYSQHLSETHFSPDPLGGGDGLKQCYRPERWLPGGLGPGSISNKSAIATFITGPHGCPGKSLAMLEMRHLIAQLVLTFDFTLSRRLTPGMFMKGFKNIRSNLFEEPLVVKVVRRGD